MTCLSEFSFMNFGEEYAIGHVTLRFPISNFDWLVADIGGHGKRVWDFMPFRPVKGPLSGHPGSGDTWLSGGAGKITEHHQPEGREEQGGRYSTIVFHDTGKVKYKNAKIELICEWTSENKPSEMGYRLYFMINLYNQPTVVDWLEVWFVLMVKRTPMRFFSLHACIKPGGLGVVLPPTVPLLGLSVQTGLLHHSLVPLCFIEEQPERWHLL